MSFLKMRRKGAVISQKSSDTQCKNTGWKDYGYEVCITCPADNLDFSGFIIDNMIVQGLVEKIFDGPKGGLSCEVLACEIGTQVEQTALEHGVKVQDIHVLLFPKFADPERVAFFEYSKSGNF